MDENCARRLEGRRVSAQVGCIAVSSRPTRGDSQDPAGKYRVADLLMDSGDAYILALELVRLFPDEPMFRGCQALATVGERGRS